MSNSNQQIDPKLQENLNFLENLGFIFFGFDENGIPLVTAPNKQVVTIQVANQFAQSQVQQSGGPQTQGVEQMPQIPEILTNEENIQERVPEKSQKRVNQQRQKEMQKSPKIKVPNKAPKMKVVDEFEKPYGDGFDLSFAVNESKIRSFVKNNLGKKVSDPKKWAAVAFEKWIEESKNNNKK